MLNGERPWRLRRRALAIAAGVWSRQRFALRPDTLAEIGSLAFRAVRGGLPPKGATSDFAAGPRPGLRPVMAACGGPLLIFFILVNDHAALPPKGATSDFAAGPRPDFRPVMAACGGPF